MIPARWGSTRFPGKLLAELGGKTVLQHTWTAAREAYEHVLIATDDLRIAAVAEAFGARVVNTSSAPRNGTERVLEAVDSSPQTPDIVVNVQGDEPHLRPSDLRRLADLLVDDTDIQVATLCHPIDGDTALDPNRVKVVRDATGDALLFSRARIPFVRDPGDVDTAVWQQHIGVYAFRRAMLERYPTLPIPPLERLEKLEQLRLVHAGIPIRVLEVAPMAAPIDTPADLT